MKSVHHRIIAAAITLFVIVATALLRCPQTFHPSDEDKPDSVKPSCGPTVRQEPASRRHLCGVGVDLNRDNEMELQYLPGIGSERARAIVQYREFHGPFEDVEELIRVPGIGPKLLANVQPFIEPI